MKKVTLCILSWFMMFPVFSQDLGKITKIVSPTAQPAPVSLKRKVAKTTAQHDDLPFEERLKPFYHGVASGDPLSDRVIIWTRVTPDAENQTNDIPVKWYLTSDVELQNVVAEGEFTTNAERDFTVKIDVVGLEPNTTYYYYFSALEANSLIGRTKTAPNESNAEHLKFAVVSCQNYEAGYFNAFGRIADRNDLDAVVHLGDYIYEYGAGTYGANLIERSHQPETEILTLADYRTRYSLYHLDQNLRRAHQQHPFITIWDDHEFSNDAYKDGAENHTDSTEGNWANRKAISQQVYNEWMPIRTQNTGVYRVINYGKLMDLIMIDTRIEGRDEQINDVTNPLMYAPNRTLLGQSQKEWFLDKLGNSTAKWKVIGNQVIFSEFNVGWAASALTPPQTPEQVESLFTDIWDGYPIERDNIIDFISDNSIDNVVWLTGDFHSTFAFDVAKRPSIFGFDQATPTYNPTTGEGSVAVEFATPSISSANFDENLDATTAFGLEFQINKPLPAPLEGVNPNPHMKYVDLDRHGYFILDVKESAVQADWFFVNRILEPSDIEAFGEGWLTTDGRNHLTKADAQTEAKATQATPAPNEVPEYVIAGIFSPKKEFTDIAILSLYPNPSSTIALVNYAVARPMNVNIKLIDLQGKVVKVIRQEKNISGNFALTFSVKDLPAGVYVLQFETEKGQISRRIVVEK
ncbi:alkaline phosphatase D family protein [Bernardetia sp.]|uniref:alkaline phosphatase D family protein n=1 Tax=Bernardetia sp. TaxID=1937974 RepID=UPI0025BADBA5|nr:alkaline phosphatase D family protein [Bernardetia sp.]